MGFRREPDGQPGWSAIPPLVPRAVAAAVWEEASTWLGEPLPRRWIAQLTAHANTVYGGNECFRRRLRRQGDVGRDWLWAFMRHWLAALIRKHRPRQHGRLPAAYNVGQPLPVQSWAEPFEPANAGKF